MPTSQESKAKIAAAERASSRVLDLLDRANDALNSFSPRLNGCAVLRNRGVELRSDLVAVKCLMEKAIAKIDAIEFPTDSDYDAL